MKEHLKKILFLLLLASSSVCGTPSSAAANAAVHSGLKTLDYRFFIAGGVCAAISHGITTPIDVVKTRMQAQPEVYDKGIHAATLSILKSDGPKALLGGLGPTVVGYGIEGAMKFGTYEVMKPIMAKFFSKGTALAYILASVIAGAVASVLLCPMESARIRIVTDNEYKGMGLLETLPKLVKESGVFNLFGGLYAMLSKQVPYTMAKQVSFDIVAGILYTILAKENMKSIGIDMKWVVSVLSASVASLFACIFSQPGDMILTETYKGSGGRGFIEVIGSIYRDKGGISGFFTGTSARILHVGLIITSQLVIYDIVKQSLGLPATGSH